MASIRKRQRTRAGKRVGWRYYVDYYDAEGKRHWLACKTYQHAKEVKAEKEREPGGDPYLTVGFCARQWLAISKPTIRRKSYEIYHGVVNNHILPTFDHRRVSKVKRADVREFLAGKLESGLAGKTVSMIQSTLSSVFQVAIENEAIYRNPAAGIGRTLHLHTASKSIDERKAFTQAELDRLLISVNALDPEIYPALFTMARTGMRTGEVVVLRWEDVDFNRSRIHVCRSADGRLINEPKTERGKRMLDMSEGLKEVLGRLKARRAEEKLKYGWDEVPPWLFHDKHGKHILTRRLTGPFRLILTHAKLPEHHSPYSLRHTFACLHILNGSDIVYVQRQMGHASIQMTADLYGRWFAKSDKAAADRLDWRDA